MPLGWSNGLPFSAGGAPTRAQLVYDALRKGRGTGGGPVGDMGGAPADPSDAWDRARARAIAAAMDRIEAAGLQTFPDWMTDALDFWEGALGLPRAATLPERQAAVAIAITSIADATVPSLRQQLQEIDENFQTDDLPWGEGVTVHYGKAFEGLPNDSSAPLRFGTGVWGARKSTRFPAYASSFIFRVRYLLPAGVTEIPDASLRAARELLQNLLPTWVDFDIYTVTNLGDGDGFYLDESLLDEGAL